MEQLYSNAFFKVRSKLRIILMYLNKLLYVLTFEKLFNPYLEHIQLSVELKFNENIFIINWGTWVGTAYFFIAQKLQNTPVSSYYSVNTCVGGVYIHVTSFDISCSVPVVSYTVTIRTKEFKRLAQRKKKIIVRNKFKLQGFIITVWILPWWST